MHLGPIYGPFMSLNLIWTQESPVPLLMFQMAPKLKTSMSSGSKKRTQICFPFSLKNPGKQNLSRFPNMVPIDTDTRLQCICISLENHIKLRPNKKALRKKRTSNVSPKAGPLWKQMVGASGGGVMWGIFMSVITQLEWLASTLNYKWT